MIDHLEEIIEAINEFLHWFLNFIGILANGWLMYVIVKKTPDNLRPYAVLMFNFALTDGVACAAAFFVMQRIIPFGMHLAYISYGVCARIGPLACYIGYCFQLHFYAHSLNSIVISFAYRLHILKRPPPTTMTMVLIVVIVYVPSLFQALTFTLAMDPVDKVRAMVATNFPDYNLTGITVTGHLDIRTFWSLYTIVYLAFPCWPLYAVVIVIRRKIYSALSSADMSERTRQTHLKLVRALTYQALLPTVFVIASFCYGLEQLSLLHHPILEFAVFQVLGLIPVLSPYLSLYFVAPYQRATLELMSRFGIAKGKLKTSRKHKISAATKSYTTTTSNLSTSVTNFA